MPFTYAGSGPVSWLSPQFLRGAHTGAISERAEPLVHRRTRDISSSGSSSGGGRAHDQHVGERGVCQRKGIWVGAAKAVARQLRARSVGANVRFRFRHSSARLPDCSLLAAPLPTPSRAPPHLHLHQ